MPLTEEWVWTPDPSTPEVWLYTNMESYTAGDAVTFHGSCSLPPAEGASSASAVITITRDSLEPEEVYASEPFDVACHEAPEQCYATGCGWPVCFTLDAIPQGWASGFYIVRCEASAHGPRPPACPPTARPGTEGGMDRSSQDAAGLRPGELAGQVDDDDVGERPGAGGRCHGGT